jgi:diadenosine tetraphosphate (Ap4A) HIT family hydrolase
MRLIPLNRDGEARRQDMARRAEELKSQGICPACRDMQYGDVYPPADDRVFYENDVVRCMLELWPRNPGHTIILVKPHFEDLSEMPAFAGTQIIPIILAATVTLKDVLGAEKVYLCTMCDGRRNHLHFQLVPRMPGDTITGSKLFVKERQRLEGYADTVLQLKRMFLRVKEACDRASIPQSPR